MNRSFALRLIPSCCLVWNAAVGGLQQGSTVGGRDKRPGARRRYGVVVVGVFAHCANAPSATLEPKTLIGNGFYRAAPLFWRKWP